MLLIKMICVTSRRLSLLLLVLLLIMAPLAGAESAEKPVVVVTTTVLGSVVRDLAGDRVEVVTILNPSLCPAHYDVKPSDVYLLQRADLVLYHGFEPWVEKLAEAAETSAPLVKVSGPWNTPEGARSYYTAVAEVLEEYLGLDTSENLEKSLARVGELEDELKAKAEELGVSKVKVISMAWVKPFVSWLGFDVIADYPPPEKLSSQDLVNLASKGEEEGAVLVIDNLQSGTGFGRSLAEKVGAVHVVLSNFPGTEPGVEDLASLMESNAGKLFNSLENLSVRAEVQSLRCRLELYQTVVYVLVAIVAAEALALGYILLRVRRSAGS